MSSEEKKGKNGMRTKRSGPYRRRLLGQRATTWQAVLIDDSRRTDDQSSIETLLSQQSCGTPSTPTHRECPEVELMRAVLIDAFECFHKRFFSTNRHIQQLAREAEEWLFTDDHSWLFSFVHICAVLGLDPDYIRQGLRRWQQAHTSAIPQKEAPIPPTHHRTVFRLKVVS